MARETNTLKLLCIDNAVRTHPNLRYLFKGALRDSLYAEFGVREITSDFTSADGYVYQPNSPKPARASKRLATPEIEGAFCAWDKTSSLRSDRFSIIQPVNKVWMNTSLSIVQYITLNGIRYGWRSSRLSAEQQGEVGNYQSLLGINNVDANDRNIVLGATFPKPPRVKKVLTDGSTFSSFCDTTKVNDAINQGWAVVDPGKYTTADLNALLR